MCELMPTYVEEILMARTGVGSLQMVEFFPRVEFFPTSEPIKPLSTSATQHVIHVTEMFTHYC